MHTKIVLFIFNRTKSHDELPRLLHGVRALVMV
jgi:hypothetical protein